MDVAKKAAALCAANVLRLVKREVGSLDRVERMVKVLGFVNSDADFVEQHLVINGASQLFVDVLGPDVGWGHGRRWGWHPCRWGPAWRWRRYFG